MLDNQTFGLHLQRLRAGASQATSVKELSRWIADNTFINGKAYSYEDHEYQERILNSEAREVVIRKCSQVGISELSVRKALAMCGMVKGFTTIYTLPTASLAAVISKTRVDPVIRESAYLSALMSETDNVEVKQLGNSYLYLKGAASSNAPISVPADSLIHDEVDFSDPLVMSQYQSRLTHSPYKHKTKLSTPTLPGKGIDYEFGRSKRHFLFVKCSCCGHQFIPDYYRDVRIPDSTLDLRDISKRNLHTVRYQDAYVSCPECGGKPELGPAHREWVCENPSENFVAEGFQVSPFDAPVIITPAYLIEAATSYSNVADFVNFNLGLPFFSQESVLSPDEVRFCITRERFAGGANVMGIDFGKTCHVVVGTTSWDGALQIIHVEEVPLQKMRERYKELRLQFRVRVTVMDSLPYTDLVLALQAVDQNAWASVYTNTRGVDLFKVKQQESERETGMQQIRQINVARDRTFDALMTFVRSGQFSILTSQYDDTLVNHFCDMRRVKDWNTNRQEVEFRWVKSSLGEDHFFFATSYAFLAKHILGTAASYGGQLPIASTFRVLAKS